MYGYDRDPRQRMAAAFDKPGQAVEFRPKCCATQLPQDASSQRSTSTCPQQSPGGDFVPGPPALTMKITTASRAGAGILTAFVLGSWLSMIYFMI